MRWKSSTGPLMVAVSAAALCAATFVGVSAQAPAPAPAGRGGGGFGRGGVTGVLTRADADQDGCVSRAEFKTEFDNLYSTLGHDQERRPDRESDCRRPHGRHGAGSRCGGSGRPRGGRIWSRRRARSAK